ncbi:ras-related protein Rab-17 isoform X2 [Macaca thibetana thibetana]|uniref:ras-related protein Rab-17 isoform X2 n=1 Tax=Macaca thibetana thibetana TaxID=257877 RepID=UPI0021BCD6AD|nr:ras-related protein Rab-17 isoform X2 [Macaca thibetana thibetana]
MAQAHRTPQPRAAPSQPRAFKLVLLGSGSVGAFFTKVVDVGTASLKLEIWDTAGQEKYHSVCHLYFRGANAALLVYDITRKDSFLKAQQWLKDLEKELHPEEVLVMLVGNKTDLSEEREVTFQVPPRRPCSPLPQEERALPACVKTLALTLSHTHTHTCTHLHMCTHTSTSPHASAHTCTPPYIHSHLLPHTYKHAHSHAHAHTCTHAHTHNFPPEFLC